MIRSLKKQTALPVLIAVKQPDLYLLLADIERIAKHLRLKPQQFIDKYLRVDEDKDYVLQSVPVLFLIMRIIV